MVNNDVESVVIVDFVVIGKGVILVEVVDALVTTRKEVLLVLPVMVDVRSVAISEDVTEDMVDLNKVDDIVVRLHVT